MNTCPFCGSEKTQGVDAPKPSLGGEYDIEQLCACINCRREFVTGYIFAKNIPVNQSTRYDAASPTQPKGDEITEKG